MSGTSSTSFLLSAANVDWSRRECTHANFAGITAASLDGDHFLIESPTSSGGAVGLYYVWFDLDAGSADPAVAGRTGIEVSIATGDSEATMATALAAAVEAVATFEGEVNATSPSVAVLESQFGGSQATTADVDTSLSFTQSVAGLGGDLGKTSGGVEVGIDTTTVEIMADQDGNIALDEVQTGVTVEVTMSLLEMTPARWKTVVGSVSGDAYTPGGGTELVGFGSSRTYSSLFDLGGRLVLHPSRYPASDRSRDITLWKSAPKPGSVNFSGDSPQLMEVTFKGLIDRRIAEQISIMAFGDGEQDVRS
jgi:hypothetical protein